MIDCNKKEDHKKCRQARIDECLGKDPNKMCEARKALETRWAYDVRPPLGTFSDQIDWAIGEIRRLRAINAELTRLLNGYKIALEYMYLAANNRTGLTIQDEMLYRHTCEQIDAALSRAELAKPEPETCVWIEIPVEGIDTYKTSCGLVFFGPLETCEYCGKRVEVKP